MRYYLFIVASMIIWSTWGLMIRWLSLPPVVVLFYTSLISSITIPAVLAYRSELDLSGVGSVWPWFFFLTFFSIVNNISYFYALGHTTVSNAVFTHYTAPILVAVLAPLIIAERVRKVTLVSLPIAASGLALIVSSNGGFRLGGEHLYGIVAGTVSGFAYAFLIIISRRLSSMLMHHKAVILVPWMTVVATAAPACSAHATVEPRAFLLLLVTGIAHSTVAPLLYYSALRHVIAQYAAILGYMEPLSAIPLAFIFLAERPSAAAIVGGILIVLSGYLVMRQQYGKKSS
jgi:drug/metabolite transporter (DMT)-like permease